MGFRISAAAAIAALAILGISGGAAASNGNSSPDVVSHSKDAADLAVGLAGQNPFTISMASFSRF